VEEDSEVEVISGVEEASVWKRVMGRRSFGDGRELCGGRMVHSVRVGRTVRSVGRWTG